MFDAFFPWLSSDASRLATWGALAALLAGFAVVAERRRVNRTRIDAVGCMPWTVIFLLGLAARDYFVSP